MWSVCPATYTNIIIIIIISWSSWSSAVVLYAWFECSVQYGAIAVARYSSKRWLLSGNQITRRRRPHWSHSRRLPSAVCVVAVCVVLWQAMRLTTWHALTDYLTLAASVSQRASIGSQLLRDNGGNNVTYVLWRHGRQVDSCSETSRTFVPSGWVVSLRATQRWIQPMRNLNVTIGYWNLLEALANLRRLWGVTLPSSSDCRQ